MAETGTHTHGLENDSEINNRSQESNEIERPARTPLPKFQLFIVFLIQFAEPITATVIYPFINQFVRETGITKGDERKTGYYAGIIESTFFFAEACTVFQWGWVSDRLGRRPVLLLGPIGLSLAVLSFGLSHNFWTLVASRCMQGIFNGNIGVSKSVMAEITDSSNIADAFAMVALMWSFGSTIGPSIGGALSRPAVNWPDTFGRINFFHEYPYFLPCAVASCISFVSGAIAWVGLKETLPSAILRQESKKQNKTKMNANSSSADTSLLAYDSNNNYGSIGDHILIGGDSAIESGNATPKNHSDKPPSLRVLLIPQVIIPLVAYALLAFVDMASQVLQPLVYSTSIPLGGLEFEPYKIGAIMGVWGVINAFIQVFFLGRVIRKFGARRMHILSQCSYVISIGLYPVLSFFVRRSGSVDANVWAVMITQLCFFFTNNMGYASIMVLIIDGVPSNASLGAANGIAQSLGSAMRSIAPSIASSLFSVSLEKHLAGGNMVYIILVAISLLGVRVSFMLPKHIKHDGH